MARGEGRVKGCEVQCRRVWGNKARGTQYQAGWLRRSGGAAEKSPGRHYCELRVPPIPIGIPRRLALCSSLTSRGKSDENRAIPSSLAGAEYTDQYSH